MTGLGKICWEYYDMFDKVLGGKSSSVPSRKVLLSTFDMEKNNNAVDGSEDEHNNLFEEGTENVCDRSENNSPNQKQDEPKKKKVKSSKAKGNSDGISVEEYLHLKNSREIEKQQKQSEKWEEEKRLREAEVDAIRELARAIASQPK